MTKQNYEIEKFEIADVWEDNGIPPVQVGDVIKVISMEEFANLDVQFEDVEMQKRIADSFVRVVNVTQVSTDLYKYTCEEVTGDKVELYDSDIAYVLRDDKCYLVQTKDNKVHTAELYGKNMDGFINCTVDEKVTVRVNISDVKNDIQLVLDSPIARIH